MYSKRTVCLLQQRCACGVLEILNLGLVFQSLPALAPLRAGKQCSSRLAWPWEVLLSCCSKQFRQDLLLRVCTCAGLTCIDKLWCEWPWHGDQLLYQGEVSIDLKESMNQGNQALQGVCLLLFSPFKQIYCCLSGRVS